MGDAQCVNCGLWIDEGDDYFVSETTGNYWCATCLEELTGDGGNDDD